MGIFLLQLLPSLFLYTMPIALFYTYAFFSYELVKKGIFTWFLYLERFKKGWYHVLFLLHTVFLIFYSVQIGWIVPYLEKTLYVQYKNLGIAHIQRFSEEKIHSLNNKIFLYQASSSSQGGFLFNYTMLPYFDALLTSKSFVCTETGSLLQHVHGVLSIKTQSIRMHLKKLTIDYSVMMNSIFEEKKNTKTLYELWEKRSEKEALKEILKRFFGILFSIPLLSFGWSLGIWNAEKNRSFVYLVGFGLLLLLFFYMSIQLLQAIF